METIFVGNIRDAGKSLSLTNRRTLIITDDGVPKEYSEIIKDQCSEPYIYTAPHGEGSKCIQSFAYISSLMLEYGFTKEDCVCAIGGGMVGDLAGFIAANYMRGLDFYNIPTTVLSQVDSAFGGKNGLNLDGVKNAIGCIREATAVFLDFNLPKTLSDEESKNGTVEILKLDLLTGFIRKNMSVEEIVAEAIHTKLDIVNNSDRTCLNFGHTIGHAIESVTKLPHGICIGLGMIPMCSPKCSDSVIELLKENRLPTYVNASVDDVYKTVLHDKKRKTYGNISVIYLEDKGNWKVMDVDPEWIKDRIKMVVEEEGSWAPTIAMR